MKLIDRTGRKYGRLTALYRDTSKKGTWWRCACECGNEITVIGQNLTSGNSKSCGCLQKEQVAARQRARKGKFQDLRAERFGRLTVIGPAAPVKGKPFWNCRCDCGATRVVMAQSLTQGKTVSCGCFHSDNVKARQTTHGLSGTREYKSLKKNERREKEAQLDFEWTLEMEYALRRFQPACVVCETRQKLGVDHVKPLSKGYGLRPGNAAVLCTSCNSQKHDKDLSELPSDMAEKIASAASAFETFWGTYHE